MLKYSEIEKNIDYTFSNKTLLETALTHTSYANEAGDTSYERLEFLGDSILGFITAQNLFEMYPGYSEGELTKTRAALVCEASLSKIFRTLNLAPYLKLGVGEEKSNGRTKESIAADAFEAILAAVFIDSDFDTAKAWLNRIMSPENYNKFLERDWKSILYEKYPGTDIEYKITDCGADCSERFSVEVFINGILRGSGRGTNKKSAVQSASKNAL